MKNLLNKIDRDRFRKKLLKYTRQAYKTLPGLNSPVILDIGCGTGVAALELAQLSNGTITGIDIDEQSIHIFNEKIKKQKLSDRIKAVKLSLFDINFPDESFDIIWSEGTIFVIGFEKGLEEWKRFLKKNGFLIIHDEFKDHEKKISMIFGSGYTMIDCFMISSDIWWEEYFKPFEKHIKKLTNKFKNDPEVQNALRKEQNEIDTFKRNPQDCSSIFYILQKF